MKSAIISLVLAIGILAGSCSTSREVRITDRDNDDGTVVKKERRVDDDGIVIKKKKRDRDILRKDEDDRDTEVRIKRDRNRDKDDDGLFDNDEPAIIIDKDRN
jgi:hypothetical protein